jgi:hypothetical protein
MVERKKKLRERRGWYSCRCQGSRPGSWPYHPTKPPSASAMILRDSDVSGLLSENILMTAITGGGPWRNEKHSHRSSSQSRGTALYSATGLVRLFCERNVLGKRTQPEQSSLGRDDVVGHMKDMRRWRVGDTSTGRPRISRLTDSTL